jgi:hypothetical protein
VLETSLRTVDAVRRNGGRPGSRASSRMRSALGARAAQRHYSMVLGSEAARLARELRGWEPSSAWPSRPARSPRPSAGKKRTPFLPFAT